MRRWAILALLWVAPASAQGIDLAHGGPITVDAAGGFEWREADRMVVATGDARATRGTSTVLADRLIAYYRRKQGAAPATGGSDGGSNEIYRLVADGHVRLFTPTDEARGDHAVYDIDQAVLVLTGTALRMTTPQEMITARDSLEYWSDKHMSVARGNALVVTTDGRRISADTLVGYSEPGGGPQGGGTLTRIEAFGNVEVRTATDIVRGGRGVYVTASQMARVVDNVRITHGETQMNGAAADVDMKTGVAHLVSLPGGRVQGLIVPDSGAPPAGAKR